MSDEFNMSPWEAFAFLWKQDPSAVLLMIYTVFVMISFPIMLARLSREK